MAYKEVTSGLTTINDVIDEIVTFMTTDLNAPWTLDHNFNITAGTNVGQFDTTASGRKTVLRKSMTQLNSELVFGDPNDPDTNYLGSPKPTEMYVAMRGVQDGIQLWPSGFYPRPESPIPTFMQGTASQMDGGHSPRPVADAGTSVSPAVADCADQGPYTKLYLFGPNQESPESANIPNYVYWVLEYDPGRYGHGMIGEYKKLVPFQGGWGSWGSDHNGNDDPTSSNPGQATPWNEMTNQSEGKPGMYCRNNQSQLITDVSPVRSSRWWRHADDQNLNDTASVINFNPLFIAGHIVNRDFLAGIGIAKLSGFTPLVTPMVSVGEYGHEGLNHDDPDQSYAPACYPEDFFFGNIENYEPGVEVSIGGIPLVPFPIVSKLTTTPRSTFGGYFYRKRT